MVKTALRSEENFERYKRERRSLKEIPTIRAWTYWRLVKNEYPYDKIFDRHDLLILARENVKSLFNLTAEERNELEAITDELQSEYDGILSPFNHTMTYPETFHLHLFHTIIIEE